MTQIEVVKAYRDLEVGRFVREGERFEVSDERAELLLSKKFVKVLFIQDDKEEKQEKAVIKTKELKTTKKTK
jgi:hypothetical protein